MSLKRERLNGGITYRPQQSPISRQYLRIRELRQWKYWASLCSTTSASRPAEIQRARLAICRTPPLADRSHQLISRWSRIPERFTFGLASGQRRDTRIHPFSQYSSSTKNRIVSLAETSGIHARPDIC